MCNDSYATMCDDCLDIAPDECEDGYECPECEQLDHEDEELERFNPDSVPAYVPIDRVNGGPAWIDSLEDDDETWFYDDDGCEREY